MRGATAIGCLDRPLVRHQTCSAASGVEHRLDGKDHSGTQLDTCARLAMMQDVRILVKVAPDPMTDVLAYDAIPITFGVGLDGRANVAEALARLRLFDA